MGTKKSQYEQSLKDCRALAQKYIQSWQPVNPEWQIVDGVAYVRLSTNEQASVAKGSLEQQVNITYEEMCLKSREDKVNYRIREFFIEEPISGQRSDRPEFLKMRRELRRKVYGFITTKEVSRLARRQKLFTDFLDELQTLNIKLIIPGFPVNPNDASQRLMIQMLSSFAEWEAVNSGNRIALNNRAAMKTSGKFNSTHKVLGLDPKQGMVGIYVINNEEKQVVEFIFQNFIALRSEEKVLELLKERRFFNKSGKVFTRSTLHRLLTNRKLIGEWQIHEKDGPITIKLPHGPVIGSDLWSQTQSILANRKSRNRLNRTQRVYPLSGLLYAWDGTSFRGFSGTGRKEKFFYYRNDFNKICLSANNIELVVLNAVKDIVAGSSDIQKAILRYRDQATTRISTLEKKRRELTKLFEDIQIERSMHARTISKYVDSEDEKDKILINELKHALIQLQESHVRNEKALEALNLEISALEAKGVFTWNKLLKSIPQITIQLYEQDPKLLKGLLSSFFKKIVVGTPNDNGDYAITLFISDTDDLSDVSLDPQSVCGNSELVEVIP